MASNQLQAIIEPAVTAMGYELVGVEYIAQGRHSLLRIYIDSEAGITVDDCADVSHQVSAILDVEDVIKGVYSLEVSSPGMDRPLFTVEHFERFAGDQVKVRLRVPLDGRRKFKGTLQGVRDDNVVVEVDGEEYLLPLDDIDKANLVAEW
jgi:ribosome maturation factor RimP